MRVTRLVLGALTLSGGELRSSCAGLQTIKRRAELQLQQKRARQHVVHGFIVALDDVERVVAAIRGAADGPAARAALQDGWSLSVEQADSVLGMSLRRLTSLAVEELRAEGRELEMVVARLEKFLGSQVSGLDELTYTRSAGCERAQCPHTRISSPLSRFATCSQDQIAAMLVSEAEQVAEAYGRPRRTVIVDESETDGAAAPETLVTDEPTLIIVSSGGRIKRVKETAFSQQVHAYFPTFSVRLLATRLAHAIPRHSDQLVSRCECACLCSGAAAPAKRLALSSATMQYETC